MTILQAITGVSAGLKFSLADLASNYPDRGSATTTYAVEIVFRQDGSVDVLRNTTADLPDEEIYVEPPVHAPAGLYVRCVQNSGQALNLGDTLNTWHSLASAQRSFGLEYTTSGGSDEVTADIDLELATDSGGSNIVAQKLGLDLNVGELL